MTKSLKLCTGICLVIQRDPIQLAKEVATLDQISQGRVILGVGGGRIYQGGAHGRPGTHHGIVVRAGSFALSGVSLRENRGTAVLVEGQEVRDYTITGCRVHDNGTGIVLSGHGYAVTGNVFSRNGTHLIDGGQEPKHVHSNVMSNDERA